MPRAGEPQSPNQAITLRMTARQASRLLDFDPAKFERNVEMRVDAAQASSLLAVLLACRDAATAEIDQLIEAVERAVGGHEQHASASRLIDDGAGRDPWGIRPLTSREREVLKALSRGDSYAEIARDLHVDVETVRSHARGVRRKLGVATSRELRGWLDPVIVI